MHWHFFVLKCFLTINDNIQMLISQLEDKVQAWQASPASSLNVWFSTVPCWSDLVVQALQFLAGETKGGRKLHTNWKDLRSFSSKPSKRVAHVFTLLSIMVQMVWWLSPVAFLHSWSFLMKPNSGGGLVRKGSSKCNHTYFGWFAFEVYHLFLRP